MESPAVVVAGTVAVTVLVHLMFRLVCSGKAARIPGLARGVALPPLPQKTGKSRYVHGISRSMTQDLAGTWGVYDGHTPQKPVVAVTGGGGFLGRAIVRHLSRRYTVLVIDKMPSPAKEAGIHAARGARTMEPGVTAVPCPDTEPAAEAWIQTDLAACDPDALAEQLREYDVTSVVHTAGVVSLADDENLCHNVNLVATQKMLRAARLAGAGTFVLTASSGAVTSPYAGYPQNDLSADFAPAAGFPYASHYSRSKHAAEELVLGADEPGFTTCAIRLPGLYGLGDNMIVDPMLSGLVSSVPTGDDVMIDFCYVENAAHAHLCALNTLLDTDKRSMARGRSFNITNGEPAVEAIETWSELLRICRPGGSPLYRSPRLLWWALALLSEGLFAFFAGNVPARRSPFWNLTRASLGFATTTITLDISESGKRISYKPRFTYRGSFDDIKRRSSRGGNIWRPSLGWISPVNPAAQVDWELRPLAESQPQRLLDVISGASPTKGELGLQVVTLLCGVGYADAMAPADWTWTQYGFAIMFAVANTTAAVQTACGQSKRWYHPGGQLAVKTFCIICVESTLVLAAVGLCYCDDPVRYAEVAVGYMLPALIVVYMTPLDIQRPTALLMLLGALAWGEHRIPRCAGANWMWTVLAVKFLVAHVPRHEPYSAI